MPNKFGINLMGHPVSFFPPLTPSFSFQGLGRRPARRAVRRAVQADQGDGFGARGQRTWRERPPLHCADGRQADGGAAPVQAQQVGQRTCVASLLYTLRRPVMGEVLSTRIWGVPPAGGPLL